MEEEPTLLDALFPMQKRWERHYQGKPEFAVTKVPLDENGCPILEEKIKSKSAAEKEKELGNGDKGSSDEESLGDHKVRETKTINRKGTFGTRIKHSFCRL